MNSLFFSLLAGNSTAGDRFAGAASATIHSRPFCGIGPRLDYRDISDTCVGAAADAALSGESFPGRRRVLARQSPPAEWIFAGENFARLGDRFARTRRRVRASFRQRRSPTEEARPLLWREADSRSRAPAPRESLRLLHSQHATPLIPFARWVHHAGQTVSV
jgi:hypothetical protein